MANAKNNYADVNADFLKKVFETSKAWGSASATAISLLQSAGPRIWGKGEANLAKVKSIALQFRLGHMVAAGKTIDQAKAIDAKANPDAKGAKPKRTKEEQEFYHRAVDAWSYAKKHVGFATKVAGRGARANEAKPGTEAFAKAQEKTALKVAKIVGELPKASVPFSSDAINLGVFRIEPLDAVMRLSEMVAKAATELDQGKGYPVIVRAMRDFVKSMSDATKQAKGEASAPVVKPDAAAIAKQASVTAKANGNGKEAPAKA